MAANKVFSGDLSSLNEEETQNVMHTLTGQRSFAQTGGDQQTVDAVDEATAELQEHLDKLQGNGPAESSDESEDKPKDDKAGSPARASAATGNKAESPPGSGSQTSKGGDDK